MKARRHDGSSMEPSASNWRVWWAWNGIKSNTGAKWEDKEILRNFEAKRIWGDPYYAKKGRYTQPVSKCKNGQKSNCSHTRLGFWNEAHWTFKSRSKYKIQELQPEIVESKQRIDETVSDHERSLQALRMCYIQCCQSHTAPINPTIIFDYALSSRALIVSSSSSIPWSCCFNSHSKPARLLLNIRMISPWGSLRSLRQWELVLVLMWWCVIPWTVRRRHEP